MSVDIEPPKSAAGATGVNDPLAGLRDPATFPPRRRWASAAGAGLALGAMLTVAAYLPDQGTPVTRPSVASAVPADQGGAAPEAAPDPRFDSGPIGPWQQMGNDRSPDPLTTRVARDGRGVLLLGDSLAARVHPALAPRLAAAKRPMAWNHWNGRPTHGTVDALVALDGQGRRPRTLVVLSGANDIFDPGEFPHQVERLLRAAGDRRVVWVTPRVERRNHGEADLHNSRVIDDALAAAAARHPNLVLVPWADHLARLGAAERSRLVPDGVHPSPAGAAELAGLIVARLG